MSEGGATSILGLIVVGENDTIGGGPFPGYVEKWFEECGCKPAGLTYDPIYGPVMPTNEAGQCILNVCSGKGAGPLKKLLGLLPEKWRILPGAVEERREETARARRARRRPRPAPGSVPPAGLDPLPGAPAGSGVPPDWVGWTPEAGALWQGRVLTRCIALPPGVTPTSAGGTGRWVYIGPGVGQYCDRGV